MKSVQVMTGNGPVNANCLAEFTYYIDNIAYKFFITQMTDGLTKSITHRESGYKVCNLSVAKELKLYRTAHSDVERAKVALDDVIAKHGAPRVRVVIDNAPLLAKYKAKQLNNERGQP